MRDGMIMRRTSRLLAAACLLGFASVLGGCGSFGAPSFDPTDMLDFLDTKKKAPGERKPVFPEGVPGINQGVPKEMVRGSAESRASAEAQAAAAAQPVEAQPATAGEGREDRSQAAAGAVPGRNRSGRRERRGRSAATVIAATAPSGAAFAQHHGAGAAGKSFPGADVALESDPASLDQTRRLSICLCMIYSENRCPLFGIMH